MMARTNIIIVVISTTLAYDPQLILQRQYYYLYYICVVPLSLSTETSPKTDYLITITF